MKYRIVLGFWLPHFVTFSIRCISVVNLNSNFYKYFKNLIISDNLELISIKMTYCQMKIQSLNVQNLKINKCIIENQNIICKYSLNNREIASSGLHVFYSEGSVEFRNTIFTCTPTYWWLTKPKCLLHIEVKGKAYFLNFS